MIIVRLSEHVKSLTAPYFYIRVIGENGNTLRISYQSLYAGILESQTAVCPVPYPLTLTSVSITSDDFTYTYSHYSVGTRPVYGMFLQYIFDVVDSAGNIVERAVVYVLLSSSPSTVVAPTDAEVYYVSLTGAVVKQRYKSGETIYIPTDFRCITFIFWDGHLEIWDKGGRKLSVDGDSAIIPLKFTIPRQIARLFANYIDDADVASIVYKVPDLADILSAIRLAYGILEGGMSRLASMGMTIYYDDNNVYIEFVTYVDLHTPLDIWRLAEVIGGIVLITIGFVIICATFGMAVPLVPGLIAGGLSLVFGGYLLGNALPLTGTSTQNITIIMSDAWKMFDIAVSKMNETKSNLSSYLDTLVSQGKITIDEKNKILSYVDNIINISTNAMKDLINKINEAYKSGYNDGYKAGVSQSYAWIAVALAGGLLLGVLISR